MDRGQRTQRRCFAAGVVCAIVGCCFNHAGLVRGQDFRSTNGPVTSPAARPQSGTAISHQRPSQAPSGSASPRVDRQAPRVDRQSADGRDGARKRNPIPLKPPSGRRVDGDSADASSDRESHESSSSAGSILAVMTVAVVFLLGIVALLFRKSPYSVQGLPREAIDVLGRRTVDPRNSIYVVKVGGKMVLLGTSANGLTPLSEVTDPVEVAALASICSASGETASDVSGWFRRLLPGRLLPGTKATAETVSFENRLGEELFAQAQEGESGSVTSLTAQPRQGGDRVRQ